MNKNVTLRLLINGQVYDISDAVRFYESFDRACNEEFHHAVSERSITLAYTPSLFALLTQDNVLAEVDIDGVRNFTGRLAPASIQTQSFGAGLSGPDVTDIKIELEDNTYLLERVISDEDNLVIENAVVCDAFLPENSCIHRLLSLCGVFIDNPPIIDTSLLAFAPEPGQSVLSVLDTLLYEYGYTFFFNAFGEVVLIKTKKDTIAPQFILDGNSVSTPFEIEKLYREYDTVEIDYYPLKQKEKALLYIADLPFGDNGLRSGWPIQPGYYWPEEANIQETWFEYQDKALGSKLDINGSVVANQDFLSIVLTKNHIVEEKVDSGVKKIIQIFKNRKARLVYRNNSDYSKNIYYCNIYGDVIYRRARVSLKSDNGIRVKKYNSEYIHDNQSALGLLSFLKSVCNNIWRFNFRSELDYPIGAVVHIDDSYASIRVYALLIEKRLVVDELYEYKAIALSDVAIGNYSESANYLPSPESYIATEENSILQSEIVVSKDAFQVLSDWNGVVQNWEDIKVNYYIRAGNADASQDWNVSYESVGVTFDVFEKEILITGLTEFTAYITIRATYKYTNTINERYKRFKDGKFAEIKFYKPYTITKTITITKVAPIDKFEFVDFCNRRIAVNPQKGLLAQDAQGKIIHDIPDQQIANGEYYLGHLVWWHDPGVTLYNGAVQSDQWYTVIIAKRSYTNIKGVILDVYGSFNPEALVSSASTRVAFRPYGSSLGIDDCFTPYSSIALNSNAIDYLRTSAMVIIPVGDYMGNLAFQFYPGVSLGLLFIGQRGVLI